MCRLHFLGLAEGDSCIPCELYSPVSKPATRPQSKKPKSAAYIEDSDDEDDDVDASVTLVAAINTAAEHKGPTTRRAVQSRSAAAGTSKMQRESLFDLSAGI